MHLAKFTAQIANKKCNENKVTLVPDSRSTCCSFGLLLLLETESTHSTYNSNLQLLQAELLLIPSAPEKTRGMGEQGGRMEGDQICAESLM